MTETKSIARHGQGRGCVITRRACFSASHRYWLPELSADDNAARFGACALAPGHGHNYEGAFPSNTLVLWIGASTALALMPGTPKCFTLMDYAYMHFI